MTMVNVRNIDKNKRGKFSALKLSNLCILRINPFAVGVLPFPYAA